MKVAGLFAGIGGIELGLAQAGLESALLCEIDPAAAAVLDEHFPKARLTRDVRELRTVGDVEVITAGFPCQDLSQAGRTAGIAGRNSGLVGHVFRLLDAKRRGPRWLLLENVSFMLQLDRGRGMRHLVDELESRGFSWAYRVVDTRAFGLPQRRQRVLLLASRVEDPRRVILSDEAGPEQAVFDGRAWCGFYWTEGLRGLGWAVDGLPTLKGGSTIGIPSPPAIWDPSDGSLTTPDLRDAERLQGFAPDWTAPSLTVRGCKPGHRWKLVGNAVSVPVAKWVGQRLIAPGVFDDTKATEPVRPGVSWPKAAYGRPGSPAVAVDISMWPVRWPREHLSDFISFPRAPLSERAASGFKSRLDMSSLRYPEEFREALDHYVRRTRRPTAVA